MTAAPFVTRALLLRTTAYGEADRVVTLLSRSHGKLSALARGARRSRGRFGASLSHFVVAEATLRERRGAELFVLEGFDARQDFSRVAADVVRMAHASYATELVRELTAPRQPDPALFDLLVELWEVVATVEPRADTLRAFELRLLDELGLRPVLDRCVACAAEGEALDRPGTVVDASRGGVLCGRCASFARWDGVTIRTIPAPARARLVEVRALSLARAAALPPAPAQVDAAARQVVHALLGTHLHGPVRSLEFLHQLARSAR